MGQYESERLPVNLPPRLAAATIAMVAKLQHGLFKIAGHPNFPAERFTQHNPNALQHRKDWSAEFRDGRLDLSVSTQRLAMSGSLAGATGLLTITPVELNEPDPSSGVYRLTFRDRRQLDSVAPAYAGAPKTELWRITGATTVRGLGGELALLMQEPPVGEFKSVSLPLHSLDSIPEANITATYTWDERGGARRTDRFLRLQRGGLRFHAQVEQAAGQDAVLSDLSYENNPHRSDQPDQYGREQLAITAAAGRKIPERAASLIPTQPDSGTHG